MRFTLFYNLPAWYKFILTVLVIIFFSFLSFVLAVLLGVPLFHLRSADMNNMFFQGIQTQDTAFLKYLQVIQSVGTFFIPAIMLGWLFTGDPYVYLKINKSAKLY